MIPITHAVYAVYAVWRVPPSACGFCAAWWSMGRCPNCGARDLKIIAAILEQPVVGKILSHLGCADNGSQDGAAPMSAPRRWTQSL